MTMKRDTRTELNDHPPASTVAVIGAGIGGMQAALLLAELGRRVALIERAPWIGGSMHLLDHTFPTDSCGLCYLEPGQSPAYCPTFECDRHPLISLYPQAYVKNVEGEAGDFLLTLEIAPRLVDVDLCNGCGLCVAVCPIEGPSPYEGNIAPRKAIYRPPARAIPIAHVIDPQLCTRCGRCVDVCPTDAIDLDLEPTLAELTAGAVIASPGFTPFAAEEKGEYGYGVFDNVITSLQFERLMSYSGSMVGRLLRPSDGRPAKKIAFISCVGSRDAVVGREYCSSVCCMITAKQATIAREADPQVESTVFIMDLRASGREYERYLDCRLNVPGIRYQRCQVSTIKQRQGSRDLLIEYWDDDGKRRIERFDLVVLAVGFGPPEDAPALGENLGISLDAYGFAHSSWLSPVGGERRGIIPIGAFSGPKDIPDTIVEASAGAALAAILSPQTDAGSLSDLTPAATRPGLEDEEPRLGVFLSQGVDFPIPSDLTGPSKAISKLPDVALVEEIPSLLTDEGRDVLIRLANEAGLNRLVIADSSSRLHPAWERQIALALGALGLPDSVLTLVDSQEEYLSSNNGSGASFQTTLESIRMAAAGLLLRPLSHRRTLEVDTLSEGDDRIFDAAVIGGGPAGLSAGTTLSEMGYDVILIEREAGLGGRLNEIEITLEGERPAEWLEYQIARVMNDERITIQVDTNIQRAERVDGRYSIDLAGPDGEGTIHSRTIILATGGNPAGTEEYGHGGDPRVITQTELESALRDDASAFASHKAIAMIQCVGSRDEHHPYCSQVCCSEAVRNALRLKRLNPGLDLFILYREMRTSGLHELAYQEARKAGAVFIRYELSDRPVVGAEMNGPLRIRVTDPIIHRPVEIVADLLVLSTGMEPANAGSWLNDLGITLSPDRFLVPEHAKMRPLNLDRPGLFACGSALGPCFIEAAIAQGHGAAIQAAIHLRREARQRPATETIAVVNERLCSGCELCIESCPYEARIMDRERHIALVVESLCAGCGACAMVCPNGATQQRLFETRSLLGVIDAAFQ